MPIIGIAGGSAGGKSTFAEKLCQQFSETEVTVLHMDSFFKKKEDRPYLPSHLSGKYYVDDNCPDTIDWDKWHDALDDAMQSGCEIVIVEGLLVFWDKYTLDRLDLRLFVDCRPDERIVRRIRRNMQWGQTFDDIADVYLDMVRFRHDTYVEPTKWCADVIINGAGNTDAVCQMCVQYIKSLLGQGK